MEQILPFRIRVPRVPVAVQFTREGLVFVLLSLAIGAAAVNTGNNILYLIFSLMLGLIVVSGVLSRRMMGGLRANVEFPSNLFAGARNVCYVSIANHKKRIPSLALRFVAGGSRFPKLSRYFFFIAPESSASGYVPVVFPRRGMYRLQEFEIQTRFPFSFFVKIRRFQSESGPVRVYPRIYHLSDDWLARFADGLLYESPYRGESHQLLHLREYAPNDSSKKIHWKASARTQRFLVKEFQREHGRDVYVYFDCYPEGNDASTVLDRAASLAASLAFLILKKGIEATFVFADRSFKIGSRDEQMHPLLDHLTELEPGIPQLKPTAPPHDGAAMVLHLRSRSVTSILPQLPAARIVTVEDSISHLEPVDSAVQEVRP